MNRLTRHSIFLVCAATLLFASQAMLSSGAWTPKRGRTYLKLSANAFESGANFDVMGNSVDPFAGVDDRYSRFRDENLSLYFETGLSDKLALFGSMAYKRIEQKTVVPNFQAVIETSGWADVDLGVRYRLSEGPNVWSLALLAKLPYLYDEAEFFALGNGQEDIEGRLLYGRGLGRGFYLGLESAYRYRTREPSDEYRFLGEFGWDSRRFYTRVKLDGLRSVDDLEQGGNINPLLNPRYDLTKLELTAGYHFNRRWHMEYTYTDTLDGKNTADGANNQWSLVATF